MMEITKIECEADLSKFYEGIINEQHLKIYKYWQLTHGKRNRFLRFFDNISDIIETELKEINLRLENVEFLKDKILFLEEENKKLEKQLEEVSK